MGKNKKNQLMGSKSKNMHELLKDQSKKKRRMQQKEQSLQNSMERKSSKEIKKEIKSLTNYDKTLGHLDGFQRSKLKAAKTALQNVQSNESKGSSRGFNPRFNPLQYGDDEFLGGRGMNRGGEGRGAGNREFGRDRGRGRGRGRGRDEYIDRNKDRNKNQHKDRTQDQVEDMNKMVHYSGEELYAMERGLPLKRKGQERGAIDPLDLESIAQEEKRRREREQETIIPHESRASTISKGARLYSQPPGSTYIPSPQEYVPGEREKVIEKGGKGDPLLLNPSKDIKQREVEGVRASLGGGGAAEMGGGTMKTKSIYLEGEENATPAPMATIPAQISSKDPVFIPSILIHKRGKSNVLAMPPHSIHNISNIHSHDVQHVTNIVNEENKEGIGVIKNKTPDAVHIIADELIWDTQDIQFKPINIQHTNTSQQPILNSLPIGSYSDSDSDSQDDDDDEHEGKKEHERDIDQGIIDKSREREIQNVTIPSNKEEDDTNTEEKVIKKQKATLDYKYFSFLQDINKL